MNIYLIPQVSQHGTLMIRAEAYIPGEPIADGPEFGTNREGLLDALMTMFEYGMITSLNGHTLLLNNGHYDRVVFQRLIINSDISAKYAVDQLLASTNYVTHEEAGNP